MRQLHVVVGRLLGRANQEVALLFDLLLQCPGNEVEDVLSSHAGRPLEPLA